MKSSGVAILIAVCVYSMTVSSCGLSAAQRPAVSLRVLRGAMDSPPALSTRLVRATDIVYLGAFRLPSAVPGSVHGFAYAGAGGLGTYGVAVRVLADGRRSLFLGGHPYENRVAEVEVPAAISLSRSVMELPIARLLQPLTDVSEGHIAKLGSGGATYSGTVVLGGLLVHGDRLVASSYGYYDASNTAVLSHWTSALSFGVTGDVTGPHRVATHAGFVAAYMAPVPSEWQAALGGTALTGMCCTSIISRTSLGPALSSFDPSRLNDDATSARQLLGYPLAHPTLGTWDRGHPTDHRIYNMGVEVHGVVLASGTRSVLFFGKTCTSASYQPGGVRCSGPLSYVWAYDANDLAAVGRGESQPWDPAPYATWEFVPTFGGTNSDIQGVAYDVTTNQIYVSTAHGDYDRPVIHVYRIV